MHEHSHDRGFTLVEVLISTTLTVLVLGAGFGALASSGVVIDAARQMSQTNQDMQVAMSLMTRDLLQAGQRIPIGGVPIPKGNGALPIIRPGPPGWVTTFSSTWTTFPAVATGGGLGPTLLGKVSDVIAVLYADQTLNLSQFPLAAIAADGSSMTVNAGTNIGGVDGIKVGDLILFSNAVGTAIQMVTGLNGVSTVLFATGDPLRFNQRTAATGTILNLQVAGAFPTTTATRIVMVSYYLDITTDSTLPRLDRQVNNGTRSAIALGAENLQFTYDLVDGVTNPTNVEDPPAANSSNQIRKVNVFLGARALEKTRQTGAYFRNVMVTEVEFRSLSFMDRYK